MEYIQPVLPNVFTQPRFSSASHIWGFLLSTRPGFERPRPLRRPPYTPEFSNFQLFPACRISSPIPAGPPRNWRNNIHPFSCGCVKSVQKSAGGTSSVMVAFSRGGGSFAAAIQKLLFLLFLRSEERRVGKECRA